MLTWLDISRVQAFIPLPTPENFVNFFLFCGVGRVEKNKM